MMYYILNEKGEYLTKEIHDRFIFQKDIKQAIRFNTMGDAMNFCEANKHEYIDRSVALREYTIKIRSK